MLSWKVKAHRARGGGGCLHLGTKTPSLLRVSSSIGYLTTARLGPGRQPCELPDAQRAAMSSPKGACDLGLALLNRAADARDRPAAAGSQGQLLHAQQQAPERSLRNQSVGLRQGPQEPVTVGEKGKFPALAWVPERGGAPISWDTASSAFTSSLTWQF